MCDLSSHAEQLHTNAQFLALFPKQRCQGYGRVRPRSSMQFQAVLESWCWPASYRRQEALVGSCAMQVSSTRWQHMSSRKPLATCLEHLRSRKGVTQGSSVPSHFPQRNSDPEMRCATPNMCTLVVTPPQSNTHPPLHASLSGPFSELIPPLCGLH